MDAKLVLRFIDSRYDVRSIAIGFLLGMAICYVVVDMTNQCMPQGLCKYRTTMGSDVTGNCKEIIPLLSQEHRYSFNVTPKDTMDSITQKMKSLQFEVINNTVTTCPLCPTCNKTTDKILPTGLIHSLEPSHTTTTTTTTESTTTTEPKDYLTLATKKGLLNLREKDPASPCEQTGWKKGQADYLSFLGLKEKYNDQVIYNTAKPAKLLNQPNMLCWPMQSGNVYLNTSLYDVSWIWENTTVRITPHSQAIRYNWSAILKESEDGGA